jgi:NADH dehydrogenase
MVISTIGQSRCILRGTENMQRDSLNRIQTNSYLQIQNYSNIWGGGDACNVMHYKSGEPCPSNALWAMKHGEHVGRNIALSIKRKALKPFKYNGLGQCASLGVGKGIGEMYGVQFTGLVAWIMRWIFFNYFMPSRTTMLREINDWMFLLIHSKRRGLNSKSYNFQTELV